MDYKFSSDLQTMLHTIGRSEGDKKFRAPASQDPMDKYLHEYFVADTAAAIFGKRRTLAKDAIIATANEDEVNRIISEAIKQDSVQRGVLASTEHYNATLAVAKPVERLDKIALRNELVKLGVDELTIAKAFDNAMVTSEPAKTLTVVTTTPRDGGR